MSSPIIEAGLNTLIFFDFSSMSQRLCDEDSFRGMGAKYSSNLSHRAYFLMALTKVRGTLQKNILPQRTVAQHASSVLSTV